MERWLDFLAERLVEIRATAVVWFVPFRLARIPSFAESMICAMSGVLCPVHRNTTHSFL